MKKVCLLIILLIAGISYSAWDNTKPADNTEWDDAAGLIRNNWDALEVVFGTDLLKSRSSYSATAPTTKSDGSTALDSNDNGSFWIDSDTGIPYIYKYGTGGSSGWRPTCGYVIPQWFGVVGNGTTNDATAFALAIDAAIDINAPLYVPSGVYLLTGMNKAITHRLTIMGEDMNDTILTGATQISTSKGIDIRDITIKDFASGIDIDTTSGNISGLYFDHVRFKGSGTTAATGINESGTNNTISDVMITNCEFDTLYAAAGSTCVGIRLRPICTDVVITHNIFQNFDGGATHAIQLGGGVAGSTSTRINVSDNVFYSLTSDTAEECHAIILYCNNSIIADNIIDTISGSGANHEAIYVKGWRNTITGNVIKDGGISEAYIALKGGDLSYDNIVSNNILTGTNANQAMLIHGGCKITGNEITLSTTGNGIRCYANPEGTTLDYEYTITGNKINSVTDGIVISDCKNTVITGNTIISATGDAIEFSKDQEATYSAVDTLIADNIISCPTAGKAPVNEFTDPTNRLIILNNVCDVNSSTSVVFGKGSSSTGYVVRGNIKDGNSMSQFTDADTTPDVAFDGTCTFYTNTTTVTITRFDGGYKGQIITVISKGAVTYDTSPATTLIGSSADIVTAAGDTTTWICDTAATQTTNVWRLTGWVDVSVNNSAWGT